jgi:hypothetical protein
MSFVYFNKLSKLKLRIFSLFLKKISLKNLFLNFEYLFLTKVYFAVFSILDLKIGNDNFENITQPIFSSATVFGIDVNERLRDFNLILLNFIFYFLIFNIIFNLIRSFVNHENEDRKEAFKVIQIITMMGFIPLTLSILNSKLNTAVTFSTINTLNIVLLFFFSFFVINKYLKYELKKFYLNLSIIVISVLNLIYITGINEIKYTNIVTFISILIFILNVVIDWILNLKKITVSDLFYENKIILLLYPLLLFLVHEIMNVLIFKKFLSYNNYISLILFTALFIFYFITIFYKISFKTFNSRSLDLFVLGFIFLSLSPNLLIDVIPIDLFETANHAVTVNEFFKEGDLPLFESFDAHFFNYSLWGILYGILTGDIKDSIYIPYMFIGTSISIFLIYIYISYFYNKVFSFLLIIFFPFYGTYQTVTQWDLTFFISISFLPFVVFLHQALNSKKFNYYLIYLSIIVSLLYRLDFGIALSFGTLIGLSIYSFRYDSLLNFIKTGLIFVSILFINLLLILYFKNVDWSARLNEVIDILNSNQLWGYSIFFTEDQYFLSILSYYIAPIISCILIILLFNNFYKNTNKIISIKIISLIAFLVSSLLMISRSLVRHSLVENAIGIIFFGIIIVYPITISYLFYNKSKKSFLVTFVLLVISLTIIFRLNINNSTVQHFFDKIDRFERLSKNKNYDSRISQINFDKGLQKSYSNIKEINNIISKPYTFINFTFKPQLYSILDLTSVSYISQNPILLNTNVSQEIYISNIEKNPNVKFAIFDNVCNTLDGVDFKFVFYRLSDYIYRNFTPMYVVNDYTIWVKNDFVNSTYLESIKYQKLDINDYVDSCGKQQHYSLGKAPYLFSKNYNNNLIKVFEFDSENINNKHTPLLSISKHSSYFIEFELKSKSSSSFTFEFYDIQGNILKYTFDVNKNTNKYLIPISTNYTWYNSKELKFKFSYDKKNISIKNINILSIK